MSDVESVQAPSSAGRASRRPTIVAAVALAVAVLCGAVSVVALVRASGTRDDLEATSSSLRQLESDFKGEHQRRLDLEGQLGDLTATVQSVSEDLSTASATASSIDSYLQTADLAGAISQLGSTNSELAQRLDDLVNCVNDNVDAISRRGQLSFCG